MLHIIHTQGYNIVAFAERHLFRADVQGHTITRSLPALVILCTKFQGSRVSLSHTHTQYNKQQHHTAAKHSPRPTQPLTPPRLRTRKRPDFLKAQFNVKPKSDSKTHVPSASRHVHPKTKLQNTPEGINPGQGGSTRLCFVYLDFIFILFFILASFFLSFFFVVLTCCICVF